MLPYIGCRWRIHRFKYLPHERHVMLNKCTGLPVKRMTSFGPSGRDISVELGRHVIIILLSTSGRDVLKESPNGWPLGVSDGCQLNCYTVRCGPTQLKVKRYRCVVIYLGCRGAGVWHPGCSANAAGGVRNRWGPCLCLPRTPFGGYIHPVARS